MEDFVSLAFVNPRSESYVAFECVLRQTLPNIRPDDKGCHPGRADEYQTVRRQQEAEDTPIFQGVAYDLKKLLVVKELYHRFEEEKKRQQRRPTDKTLYSLSHIAVKFTARPV